MNERFTQISNMRWKASKLSRCIWKTLGKGLLVNVNIYIILTSLITLVQSVPYLIFETLICAVYSFKKLFFCDSCWCDFLFYWTYATIVTITCSYFSYICRIKVYWGFTWFPCQVTWNYLTTLSWLCAPECIWLMSQGCRIIGSWCITMGLCFKYLMLVRKIVFSLRVILSLWPDISQLK